MKIFRRSYTKPLPSGAKILKRRGGPVARWCTRGVMHEGKLTASRTRVLCRSKDWFVECDINGVVHEIKLLPDKASAETIGGKIGLLVAHAATGQPIPAEVARWLRHIPEGLHADLVRMGLLQADRRRPGCHSLELDDLLQLWEQSLCDAERSERYVKPHVRRAAIAFESCDFTTWADIDVDDLRAWLLTRRQGPKGINRRTFNYYAQSCRQFTRYVVTDLELADIDPLRKLKPLDKVEKDVKHPRRILEPAELAAVLLATEAGPVRQGLDGASRALLYRFMAGSGLRLNECRALRVCDLDLSSTHPTVKVWAKHAKSGEKTDPLPLASDLVDVLRAYVAARGKLPTAAMFTGLSDHAVEGWQNDLEAANVAYIDAAGVYADLHGLRHYYGTRLAESGLSIHEVKRLMRHSKITTTERYMHAADERARAAVESLPKLATKAG